MDLGRDRDHPDGEVAVSGRPFQDLPKGLPLNGWIPLDDDQFCREMIGITLGRKGSDEGLQAPERVTAVGIVPGDYDDAQVWFRNSGHTENSADPAELLDRAHEIIIQGPSV